MSVPTISPARLWPLSLCEIDGVKAPTGVGIDSDTFGPLLLLRSTRTYCSCIAACSTSGACRSLTTMLVPSVMSNSRPWAWRMISCGSNFSSSSRMLGMNFSMAALTARLISAPVMGAPPWAVKVSCQNLPVRLGLSWWSAYSRRASADSETWPALSETEMVPVRSPSDTWVDLVRSRLMMVLNRPACAPPEAWARRAVSQRCHSPASFSGLLVRTS